MYLYVSRKINDNHQNSWFYFTAKNYSRWFKIIYEYVNLLKSNSKNIIVDHIYIQFWERQKKSINYSKWILLDGRTLLYNPSYIAQTCLHDSRRKHLLYIVIYKQWCKSAINCLFYFSNITMSMHRPSIHSSVLLPYCVSSYLYFIPCKYILCIHLFFEYTWISKRIEERSCCW